MARKILYQTLQDLNNPDEVRQLGPFECTSDEAWLGHGYYFWDTFEHLGHFWGEAMIKGPYMICKAQCDFDSKVCFDLQGETEHMALFASIVQVMVDEGLVDDDTTVSDVIYHLNNKLGIFHWKAVRASGVHTVSDRRFKQYTFRMKFVADPKSKHFLDYQPAIQLCIYDLEALKLKDLEIIYPKKYILAG